MDVDELGQDLLSAFSSMNTNDRDELVKQFQSLLCQSVSIPTSEFYLEMNSWNLQQAICSYYDLENNNQENLPQMSFVQDVTIGEGESVPPRSKFVKTWKIRNSGWESWPPGSVLRFTGMGHQMTHLDRIALPPLRPGEMCDASVEMESPGEPGIYQGQWRMCTPTGVFCGETIWVIVQVDENGLMSLTQQLASMPINSNQYDVSKSPAYVAARNPFASAAFPGNNSPSNDSDPWKASTGADMED